MEDLIDLYMRATEHEPTTVIYRQWAALGMIAGVLSRRVFTRTKAGPIYPNLYVMMVGTPGTGKSASMQVARRALMEFEGAPRGKVELAPDTTTLEAMMQGLGFYFSENFRSEPGSFVIMADELMTLFVEWEPKHFGTLTKLWDAGTERFKKTTKTAGNDFLKGQYVNFIVGVQPSFLATGLPEYAFQGGLTRRLMFVHASEDERRKWVDCPDRVDLDRVLHQRLSTLTKLKGVIDYTPEAMEALIAWERAGAPPRPTDPLLVSYLGTRVIHISKMALLMALAAHPDDYRITLKDLERAWQWLFEAEKRMPEALLSAGGNPYRPKEDAMVKFLAEELIRQGKSTLPERDLLNRLSRLGVSTDRINMVFEMVIRQGRIICVNPDNPPGTRIFKMGKL